MATIPKPFYFYRSEGRGGFDLVRPVLGSFNMVVANEAHIYPKHQHLNYQLIFAQRGCYRCVLNEVELALKPRDVLIVKRGDWHEDICASGIRYLAINFDLAGNEHLRVGDILFDKDVSPEQQVVRGPNNAIWRILDQMRDEPKRDDHDVAHIENALLVLLFWSLVRTLPREHLSSIFLQQSATQAFSERLRRLFDRHLTENLSAAAIASELGIGVRTLTKRCWEAVGRPPLRAFMHYKMDYAARVLRQSEIPIKEISHRLGFQNQYHFSRVFRRYLGTPPSTYREPPQ
jgi:AraC-like DNA-binding protein